jgi:hypothetical protein
VCTYLLGLSDFNTWDGKEFVFSGKHSRITACSLPEELPGHIIQKMLLKFGGQLRQELIELKQQTEIAQACPGSPDSKQLSVESLVEYRHPFPADSRIPGLGSPEL